MTQEIADKMGKIFITAKLKGDVVIEPLIEAYFSDLSSADKSMIASKIERRLRFREEKSQEKK